MTTQMKALPGRAATYLYRRTSHYSHLQGTELAIDVDEYGKADIDINLLSFVLRQARYEFRGTADPNSDNEPTLDDEEEGVVEEDG